MNAEQLSAASWCKTAFESTMTCGVLIASIIAVAQAVWIWIRDLAGFTDDVWGDRIVTRLWQIRIRLHWHRHGYLRLLNHDP